MNSLPLATALQVIDRRTLLAVDACLIRNQSTGKELGLDGFGKATSFDDSRAISDRFALLSQASFQAAEQEGDRNLEDSFPISPANQVTPRFQAQVLSIHLTEEDSCCLCGREWEVQFVEVAILSDSKPLGIVCPACLQQSPHRIAERFEDDARRLIAHFQQLHACLVHPPGDTTISCEQETNHSAIARLRDQCEQLGETCKAIRQNDTRLRGVLETKWCLIAGMNERYQQLIHENRNLLNRCAQLPSDVANQLTEGAEQLEGMLVLGEYIKKIGKWPVSIEYLVQEERGSMKRRFPGLRDEHIQRLVDDRYRKFLSCSA